MLLSGSYVFQSPYYSKCFFIIPYSLNTAELGCLESVLAKVNVKSLSRGRLFGTPWTAARQAPASMGFSRQEYWSGVPLPSLLPYLEAVKFHDKKLLTARSLY